MFFARSGVNNYLLSERRSMFEADLNRKRPRMAAMSAAASKAEMLAVKSTARKVAVTLTGNQQRGIADKEQFNAWDSDM